MVAILQQDPIPLAVDPHGVIRVGGTRVTLDTIVRVFQSGATAEQIADDFPALPLADIYGAINYYLKHRADVEAYLGQQQTEVADIRRELGAHQDAVDIRARLLNRRTGSTQDR